MTAPRRASIVRPNLLARSRVPKTFVAVVALFGVWLAVMTVAILRPPFLNTLFFMSQQISGWIFMIAVAIVGAVFIGMFISHRLLTHGGFTPFEEEMLRMRKDVAQMAKHTEKYREELSLMRLEIARVKAAMRVAERQGPETDSEPVAARAGEEGDSVAQFGR